MASLASCWLLVESFVVPHGFVKWFYLSFYIHPFFLAFCQLLLWLKILQRWILIAFIFPFRIACCLSLFIFKFLNKVLAVVSFSLTRPNKPDVFYDAMDNQEFPHNIPAHDCGQIFVVSGFSSRFSSKTIFQSGVFVSVNECKFGPNSDTYEETDQNSCLKDSWLHEYLSSDYYTNSLSTYDVDTDDPKHYEGISLSISLSGLKKIPNSITNQESIQDSEISASHLYDAELLDDMLNTSHGGTLLSPFSNSDVNTSLTTTDVDSYTLPYKDSPIDCEFLLEFDITLIEKDSPAIGCELLPEFDISNSPVRESEQDLISRSVEEDLDPFFHHKYTERLRFFDVLYHERLYGMNAILNEHLTSTHSSTEMSMQYMAWDRMARKRILRSLENDFELIYVAQSCLFWEALHCQYRKVVEFITSSDDLGNRLFHHSVSGKFQEVQILLQRFVEEQKSEGGQRNSDQTHKRLSFQALIRVPDIIGFMEQENNSMGGEAIRAAQVLKAIEKCIKAFWLYVKTDNKKSLWKYKGIWGTQPPLEDPQDLELLYNVSNTLHKKGIMLKDLRGKKKCWLRRKVKPVLQALDENINLLFAMIDMKLVQRVLKMSIISTSHLNWCKDKLNNLEFREGKVYRGVKEHLFPS